MIVNCKTHFAEIEIDMERYRFKLLPYCLSSLSYNNTSNTVGGFTTSTHFDDSIAGLTLERFMSLSKSKCELKEA